MLYVVTKNVWLCFFNLTPIVFWYTMTILCLINCARTWMLTKNIKYFRLPLFLKNIYFPLLIHTFKNYHFLRNQILNLAWCYTKNVDIEISNISGFQALKFDTSRPLLKEKFYRHAAKQ